MDDVDIPERMLRRLFIQMIREGVIDSDLVQRAADQAEEAGDVPVAQQLRCLPLRAFEPSPSEWRAERARSQFRVIPDGGNEG